MATLRHQLNRFKVLIIILIILLIIVALIAIRRSANSTLDPSLNIQSVQVRNVLNVVTSEGNLHGNDERFVYLPTGTKVSEVDVSLNQNVNKDDILGVVEALNGAKTNITSPITGTITQINFKAGDQVNSATPGFQVADLTSYKIQISINETDIPNIKVDQTAKVSFPAISLDTEYDSKVTFVSTAPLSTTGVVNYEVDLTPTSALPADLKLGMSADVNITTAEVDNVLAIPETYLIEKNNKDYVKVLTYTNDQKTQYTITEEEIQVGLKTNEYIEVKSGVSEGDQIVEPSYVAPKAFSLFGN